MKMLHSCNKYTFDFSETISKRGIVFFYLRNVNASWNVLKAGGSISTMLAIQEPGHWSTTQTMPCIWIGMRHQHQFEGAARRFCSLFGVLLNFEVRTPVKKKMLATIYFPATTQPWGWSFIGNVICVADLEARNSSLMAVWWLYSGWWLAFFFKEKKNTGVRTSKFSRTPNREQILRAAPSN